MSTEIVSYGPWFVNDEGGLVIKRQMLDEDGNHAGYQLLEGEYDSLASIAAIGQKAVEAAASSMTAVIPTR